MNRRKSLGDIWGSISSKVSPRRLSISHGRGPDWFDDSGRSTCLNETYGPTSKDSTHGPAVSRTNIHVVETLAGIDVTQASNGRTSSKSMGAEPFFGTNLT